MSQSRTTITGIHDLLGEGGRLDYPALRRLAEECPEQHFIRLLGHWVLAGDRVVRGRITPSASDAIETVRFEPGQREPLTSSLPGNLAEVIYVFHKPTRDEDGMRSFTLGRVDDNDFVMPDYAVSRTQAVIHVFKGTRFRIRSLGGSNPVLVNNRPVERDVVMREGDVVSFGRFRFLLLAPSALYLRLKGIKPQLRIRQLINALGQADYKALKEYADKHDEEIFAQLMRYPSLVGSGVFRGYSSRVVGSDPEATHGFLPDVSAGPEAVPVRVLGRSIYPLIRPERLEENGEEYLTIGRAVENDLMMGDDAISNFHARIRFGAAGEYFIGDLHSTNGVFVRGRELGRQEQELFDRDRVKIGRHEFTLMFPSTLYQHLTGGGND
ncbi:MAG: FHA domain-containing protein [Magnetococcales bacterium]|nr:FHA domain-containing protein [Magnetococcales bacterium]